MCAPRGRWACPTGSIIWRHVLPNAMVATLTFLPFILNGSITTLTSLDFLGFGLPPGSPSLGELLAQGKANLQAPWLGLTAFFVLAVMLSLLIFIGEAVRDAFDPRKVTRDRRAHDASARIRDLSVTFAGRRGEAPVEAVQRRLVRARPRRDPGAGRRMRLGQDRDGAVDPAAAALPAARHGPGSSIRFAGEELVGAPRRAAQRSAATASPWCSRSR